MTQQDALRAETATPPYGHGARSLGRRLSSFPLVGGRPVRVGNGRALLVPLDPARAEALLALLETGDAGLRLL